MLPYQPPDISVFIGRLAECEHRLNETETRLELVQNIGISIILIMLLLYVLRRLSRHKAQPTIWHYQLSRMLRR